VSQIEVERGRVADLQERAVQLTEHVERQRKEMGGLNAAADEDTHVRESLPGSCLWQLGAVAVPGMMWVAT
jgi:hypothetical protein